MRIVEKLYVSIFLFCSIILAKNIFADEVNSENLVQCKYNAVNVKTVLSFQDAILKDRSFSEASKYLGATYKQHYPLAEDGAEGLRNYLDYAIKNETYSRVDLKKIFGCGDYVMLQNIFYKSESDLGTASINTFRLKNGKIVEHWEIAQPVPKDSKNSNGIF